MKLAISQIRKKLPFNFSYDFDLMANLVNKPDLLACKKCLVEGVIFEQSNERFLVRMSFDLDLVFQCAISLEEVPYQLQFDQDVYFSYDDSDDDYPIERETLNIDLAVLSEIVINLPYRVVKEEYEDTLPTEEEEL